MKFSPEMYEAYQTIKPMMMGLYPLAMKPEDPLPLTIEAQQKMITDPYIRYSDNELAWFFTIWLARREYTMNICRLQKLYDENGVEVCDVPHEVLAERASHLARFTRTLDMSNRTWKRLKAKVHGYSKRTTGKDDFNPWGRRDDA